MLGVFETQFTSDLANGFFRIEDFLFGNIDQIGLYLLLGGFACFFFNQVAEIVWR